jgi:branched-chain amino acid transport system permease protein
MFYQQLINGISLGGIYSLITIGYSMVYGIMKLMNFAHGDVYMFGTFITFTLLVKYKMNIFVAGLLGMLTGALLAALVEIFAYRRLRAENRAISMITALGAAYIIQNGEEIFWGVDVQRFPSIVPMETINLLGVNVSMIQLLTLILSVILIIGFHLFLNHHKLGKAILCLAQDIPTASLMGIPVNRTISLVYALGGILGVIGGILYASAYNIVMVAMGFSGTIIAFTAAVFGGVGNLKGAILGSLILGICQSLAGAYLSTTFRDVISFGLLIGFLLIRPSGIFAERTVEKV